MKNKIHLAFVGAIVMALILSLLSLFVVSTDQSIPEEYRQERLVTGAAIYCDNRVGASKDTCSGEYFRGWPILYGEGEVFKSTAGYWTESFSINWSASLVNYLFWIIPSLAIAAVIVVSLYEQEENPRD